MTNATSPDLKRIKMEIILAKKKQGAYGCDRIKAVKYYFKQMI